MGLTFPSDLFPSEVVASVTGLSGLAAGLAVCAEALGLAAEEHSAGVACDTCHQPHQPKP
jgi:ACS family hexuronate transporter-like MFS transporter